MIGIFSGSALIRVPVAIRLFDGIMLSNLVLMSLIVGFARIPIWIPSLVFYLALSGTVGILRGTDTIVQVAKEFLGISVSVVYFCYFFRMIGNDFERAFKTYARVSYWFAVIAFPLWIASCIYFQRYDRLKGLNSEPALFCYLALPAWYWFTGSYFSSRRHGREAAVLTIAMILSASSLGYLGIAFGTVLLLSGRIKHFAPRSPWWLVGSLSLPMLLRLFSSHGSMTWSLRSRPRM